ncbi:MAG: YlbG family protein [Streptococcaceae bacterium]|jgi:uncharacterized protein YlbG (UPF0298 family)|nr:YlbG family protein [Streptococcaceae bacterium]
MAIDEMRDDSDSFEIKDRRALYVFYKSARNARFLSKYGEVIFNSKKHNYSCLYVDADKLEAVREMLQKEKFVLDIQESVLDTLSTDFGSAFVETNAALKDELGEPVV